MLTLRTIQAKGTYPESEIQRLAQLESQTDTGKTYVLYFEARLLPQRKASLACPSTSEYIAGCIERFHNQRKRRRLEIRQQWDLVDFPQTR